jgi:hypothetical protein
MRMRNEIHDELKKKILSIKTDSRKSRVNWELEYHKPIK